MTTQFDKRAEILAELWIRYKNDETFQDFIQYNDLGLPLAYALSSGIITQTPKLEAFVNETWEILLSATDMEDKGFSNLDEILGDESPNFGIMSEE